MKYNQVQSFQINDYANHYLDIKITGCRVLYSESWYCRQGIARLISWSATSGPVDCFNKSVFDLCPNQNTPGVKSYSQESKKGNAEKDVKSKWGPRPPGVNGIKILIMMTRPQNITVACHYNFTVGRYSNVLWPDHHYQNF